MQLILRGSLCPASICYYDYAPDNRLEFAQSSIDDNCWILEASYFYYKHGPLSRIELGRNFNKVQGMDYAYTLQGWIKGMNASFLDPNRDMGKDGLKKNKLTGKVRKDAVGYTINYFDDDYKPIGATAKTDAGRFDVKMTNSSGDYRSKGLFNGNIRSIASQTEGLGNPILMSYDYDQLNRLNKMESNNLTINTNTWNRATPAESRWREDVTYDANGNIKAYKRNDQFGTVLMDNLQYSYTPNTNQLSSVADYAPPSTYKDDVEGITGNTFQYDKIGNLTYETKNGSRSVSFNWNVYGKMLTAYDWDYDAQNVVVASYAQYSYDAQQNRFKKQQTTSRLVNSVWQNQTSTDYYIRDAQGNILAIYQAKDNNFVWKEQHLYGSSRLGMWQPEKVLSGVVLPMLGVCGDGQGVRLYELTNHLGNVLATINDKGKVVSAQDYYPFGMSLPGRIYPVDGSNTYRYSFNGKEYEGTFKQQDYGMRIYRFNLGRFLSVDPIKKLYPELTPYQFAGNKPIQAIDLDGLEPQDANYGFPDCILCDISNNTIDQVGNLMLRIHEYVVIDQAEGAAIRSKLKSGGVDIGDDVSNKTLGSLFQFKKMDRELTVQFDEGILQDGGDVFFGALSVASLYSPGGAGLLAKSPITATVAGQLRKLFGEARLGAQGAALLEVAKDFKNVKFNIGGSNLLLDKAGFLHVLARHSKKHFVAFSETDPQSFFKDGMKPTDIVNLMERFINKYSGDIKKIMSGEIKKTSLQGEIDGVKYQLGLRPDKASIGQFTPWE